jgi:hypothetical protein
MKRERVRPFFSPPILAGRPTRLHGLEKIGIDRVKPFCPSALRPREDITGDINRSDPGTADFEERELF